MLFRSFFPSESHDVLAFRSISVDLQNGDLSESMTKHGKEIVARRWPGMLGKLDVRDALDQSYSVLSLVIFSRFVSKLDIPQCTHR